MGLDVAQGLQFTAPFYWDRDDETAPGRKRFMERNKGVRADLHHAGAYSAMTHYLKAVQAAGTDAGAGRGGQDEGHADQRLRMKNVRIREDGQVMRPVYAVAGQDAGRVEGQVRLLQDRRARSPPSRPSGRWPKAAATSSRQEVSATVRRRHTRQCTTHRDPHPCPATRDLLGECPVWDARDQSLYWVDSKAPRVRRLHPASGELREWHVPQDIGSIALADSGRLRDGARETASTCSTWTAARLQPLAPVQHPAPRHAPERRPHATARAASSRGSHGASAGTSADGELYRLDGRRPRRACSIAASQSPTAPASAPTGDRLYFADSHGGIVQVCDYDGAERPRGAGAALRRHAAARLGARRRHGGCRRLLWVALVLAGASARFRPDGSLDRAAGAAGALPDLPLLRRAGPGRALRHQHLQHRQPAAQRPSRRRRAGRGPRPGRARPARRRASPTEHPP